MDRSNCSTLGESRLRYLNYRRQQSEVLKGLYRSPSLAFISQTSSHVSLAPCVGAARVSSVVVSESRRSLGNNRRPSWHVAYCLRRTIRLGAQWLGPCRRTIRLGVQWLGPCRRTIRLGVQWLGRE